MSFTLEESSDDRLPFLNVLITAQEKGFSTQTHQQRTENLNGESECPQQYLSTTTNAYVLLGSESEQPKD
ncbi:hypothetical protein E2C01_066127 [Portunus trituberculatus]|uniref:Uncharacterized protein n=1 Tax=Portunus trituberculatus TaxID=210409 RepID=A0A5B7HRG5_PORTR|nr:hypothetical protein [Portunus trituberculatus]